MPSGASSGGKKTGNSRAIATRALDTRMTGLLAETNGPETRMAVAGLASAAIKYSSFSANVRSPDRALSAEAKPVSGVSPLPMTSPRIFSAIWATVKDIEMLGGSGLTMKPGGRYGGLIDLRPDLRGVAEGPS